MVGEKAIVIALNKLLNAKDTDHPKINAMFMRLVVHDKATWAPLYQAYLTKQRDGGKPGEKEPEVQFPYDRGGK